LTHASSPTHVIRRVYETGASTSDPGGVGKASLTMAVLEGVFQLELKSRRDVVEAGSSVVFSNLNGFKISNCGPDRGVVLVVSSDQM